MEIQFDSFVVGLIYVITVLVEVVFYVPCMIVIKTDNELKQHSRYRMMFKLGIADCVHLCSQFCAGITLMTGVGDQIPHWLNKLWSCTQNGVCWYYYIITCHIIAINRFITICLPAHISERLFSPKGTTIWICVCVVYAGSGWLFDISPLGGWVFIPEAYSFYWDETAPMYETNKLFSWWQTVINLNISAVWYACIIVYMCVKRHSLTSTQNSMQDRERRILIQANIFCFYPLMLDQYYHLAPVLFKDYNFKYAYAVANWLWISNSGINPLVYLTINKTIKNKVKSMFRKCQTNSVRVHPQPGNPGNRMQQRGNQQATFLL